MQKKRKNRFRFFFPFCVVAVCPYSNRSTSIHTSLAPPQLTHLCGTTATPRTSGQTNIPWCRSSATPHTHCDVAACSAGWVRDYAQYRHNAPKAEDWRWMRTFVEASTQYAVNCPKRGGHGRGSLRHSTSPDLSADTKRVGVRDPDTMARWPASSGPKRLGCAKR